MATTTNYSWTTPDDTALVKDGAAAIRSLGTAIDTTVFNNASAAIAKTIVDAKGDIIAATAADTVARLGVGTNGQLLTADSSTATGLAWTTVSSTPSFVGAMIYKTATQTLANSTYTAIEFSGTDYLDTNGFHDPSTNNTRMTIPAGKGGKYLVFGNILYDQYSSTLRALADIYINGSAFSESVMGGGNLNSVNISAIVNLSAGDYVELFGLQMTGGNHPVYGTTDWSIRCTAFGLQYLGA